MEKRDRKAADWSDTKLRWQEDLVHRTFVYLPAQINRLGSSQRRRWSSPNCAEFIGSRDSVWKSFPVRAPGYLPIALLTNNRKLAHAILSPKKHVSKIYPGGIMDEADVACFEAGIALKLHDAQIADRRGEWECQFHVEIEIAEEFHQVKRMVAAPVARKWWIWADFWVFTRSDSSIGRMAGDSTLHELQVPRGLRVTPIRKNQAVNFCRLLFLMFQNVLKIQKAYILTCLLKVK